MDKRPALEEKSTPLADKKDQPVAPEEKSAPLANKKRPLKYILFYNQVCSSYDRQIFHNKKKDQNWYFVGICKSEALSYTVCFFLLG